MKEAQEYLEWVKKFEIKKTADSTFTPPAVYVAVMGFVMSEYGVNPDRVIRPFFPGGDYEREDYSGLVVVDNPPFSIISKIVRFYESRGIPYFLFAPALTAFSAKAKTTIITNATVRYENGAKIATAFVTNLDKRYAVRTAPELNSAIKAVSDNRKNELPVYEYPAEVITAARLRTIAGVHFAVPFDSCSHVISKLESQSKHKKTIFGQGRLISRRAAAEVKAAEVKAAEVKAAEVKAARAVTVWELSDDEKRIVESLGGNHEA